MNVCDSFILFVTLVLLAPVTFGGAASVGSRIGPVTSYFKWQYYMSYKARNHRDNLKPNFSGQSRTRRIIIVAIYV
jgi:hypothetical protein